MKKIIYTLLLISFSLTNTKVFGQSDMISYGLIKTLPQANNLNPAILPDYKFSMGFPGLSGFHTNTAQNFTNMAILFSKDAEGNVDTDNIFNNLRRNNRISTGNTVNIFHLGVRGTTSYTAFSINTKFSSRFSLPRELFALPLYGNASGQLEDGLADLSRLSTKTMGYTEVGLSHGREILAGKMTIGVRIKYLAGHAYADLNSFDASLRTFGNDDFRGDSIQVNSNSFDIRTAGIVGALVNEDNDQEDIIGSLLANRGFGLDLGATYDFTKKIKFFASLNDVGFIKWGSNYTNRLNVPEFQYTFKGADIVELINGEDLSVIDEIDSAISDLDIQSIKNESFSTALTAKLYAGASYELSERQTASAILYSEFFKGAIIPAFTAMYNFQGGTFFNFGLSATVMNGRVNNFGTGMTLNLIPFQLVLATNDLGSIINPIKGRGVDFRFGINHTFGNVNKSKSRAKKNSENTIDTIDLGID
ncbi:DUF5723 family protein [Marivirga sp.]|uniref:DUF5723 family protein n=1 Tax=Marivirga sp. TaxID=2018662 RepID=UPI002D7E9959|nr:DUF5723 family protein [Marivirga sp.]HET8859778.1 DUF5723 family protein [Marivirga sp.]